MKIVSNLLGIGVMFCFLVACSQSQPQAVHRENGWYYVLGENQDSLSREPIVTVKEFAEVHLDSDTSGVYVITGVVSKHKQQDWADATERAVGKHIAFVFNDSIVSSPQVNQRIESGNFQISIPRERNSDIPTIFRQLCKEKIDTIDSLFHDWETDSTYTSQEQDSMKMEIDYWEAKMLLESFSNPELH